jgi:putative phosphoesterase
MQFKTQRERRRFFKSLVLNFNCCSNVVKNNLSLLSIGIPEPSPGKKSQSHKITKSQKTNCPIFTTFNPSRFTHHSSTMQSIGILSDTHSFVPEQVYAFFKDCDEIWHAGDIGNFQSAEDLRKFKPLRAVYGNIDGGELRMMFPRELVFYTEKVKVVMTHIGGYPGRYDKEARELIVKEKPQLFVTGHSHILKVMFDKKYQMLFINPGAAGKYGFHKSITMVRFVVDGSNMRDLEILDIPRNEMVKGEGCGSNVILQD